MLFSFESSALRSLSFLLGTNFMDNLIVFVLFCFVCSLPFVFVVVGFLFGIWVFLGFMGIFWVVI